MNALTPSTSQQWPPAGVRYPYILPNPVLRQSDEVEMDHVGPSRSSGASNDMAHGGFVDEEMIWEPTHEETIRYLALDTNVLIHHLSIVKDLHEWLQTHRPPIILLIPSAVINELDRLGSSRRATPAGMEIEGNEERSAADGARIATSWLLGINRARKERGWGVLRCQRWIERLDKTLQKGDDKILDCCLYFMSPEGSAKSVTLWTEDRNLTLLAETNEIPAIGGRYISLERILRTVSPDLSDTIIDTLSRRTVTPSSQLLNVQEDEVQDDMEIDLDIWPDPIEEEVQSEVPQTPSPMTRGRNVFSLPVTPRNPSPRSLDDTLDTLSRLVLRILSRLTGESDHDHPPTSLGTLHHLQRILVNLERTSRESPSASSSPSPVTISLLKAIASMSTIIKYFEVPASPSPTKYSRSMTGTPRRPRRGQVVEALETLVISLDGLDLLEDEGEDLLALIQTIS